MKLLRERGGRKFDAELDGIRIEISDGLQNSKVTARQEADEDDLLLLVLAFRMAPGIGTANSEAEELLLMGPKGERIPGERLKLDGVGDVEQHLGRAVRPSDESPWQNHGRVDYLFFEGVEEALVATVEFFAVGPRGFVASKVEGASACNFPPAYLLRVGGLYSLLAIVITDLVGGDRIGIGRNNDNVASVVPSEIKVHKVGFDVYQRSGCCTRSVPRLVGSITRRAIHKQDERAPDPIFAFLLGKEEERSVGVEAG